MSETENAQDLTLAREVAPFFRVSPTRTGTIVGEVVAAVATWREVATAASLSRASQAAMAPAFRFVP